MKRLLLALAACAATLFASAAIKTSVDFEGSLGGFVQAEGSSSTAKEYGESSKPSPSYPFDSAGSYFCAVDEDETALTSPAASGATYFDMYVQFPANAGEPDATLTGAKIAVYRNPSSGKLAVIYGTNGANTNDTNKAITPDAWTRLTIAKVTGGYKVYVNGDAVDSGATFAPINSGDPTVTEFTGVGKLDNYVARTTDPFIQNPAATIDGGEGYASYSEALTDVLAEGEGKTLTYIATSATGDGTSVAPYVIPDLASLKAFQAAIAASNGLTKCYALTADIALDAAWPGIGLQNGKDAYNTDAFNNAAFQGTFDGQNHTISGFQMVGGGLDYCGFFNSIYGATIQNLKIQYAGSLFAADTTQNSSLESGATFVGVAKSSTLRNLTTLSGTVSCDKGFGGIVGYLTSGTLVDSCTNNVNMTSLKPNKCGGIAMITQGGSAVTIRDCQNNGSVAGSNEIGSLIGYIGNTTTVERCESTVAFKLFHHQDHPVTISGVAADASVVAYTGAATPGLNFATVDNGVATFVADDALAAGNTYKVMADGATATYAFSATGTIAFDTTLFTPTYAITAGNYKLTDSTVDHVKTYTCGMYVVRFVDWDSTLLSSPGLQKGDTPSYSGATPTREGWTFTTWTPAIAAVTDDATYVATYTKVAEVVVTPDETPSTTGASVTTMVAVPSDCNVDELIDLEGRVNGDVLKAYSKAYNCYYSWTLNGSSWEPNAVTKISDSGSTPVTTPAAASHPLKAGEAVWVTTTSSSAIKIKAPFTSTPKPVSVSKGWNLVAPTTGKDTTVKTILNSTAGDNDQIVILTKGAPKTYTKVGDDWGYASTEIVEKGGKKFVKPVRKTDDTDIPAGKGVFFVSGDNNDKNINL